MSKYNKLMEGVDSKGGVEDTTLDAKDTKNEAKDRLSEDRPFRGQEQECSRPKPRTLHPSVIQEKKKKGLYSI